MIEFSYNSTFKKSVSIVAFPTPEDALNEIAIAVDILVNTTIYRHCRNPTTDKDEVAKLFKKELCERILQADSNYDYFDMS